jgi:hypothetical protein
VEADRGVAAVLPHDFPIPHIDAVESVINYRVPINRIAEVAEFDGSIVVERTAGEVSARCHGEEANFLAINLMHDIVMGTKTPKQAREYYVRELAGPASRVADARTWTRCGSCPRTIPPIRIVA